MGDRGNIKIGEIYLYTHWGGSELKQTLKTALKKRARWTDEPYLIRIIFCEMIKDDIKGEAGYGISTSICDNEHNILDVNVKRQTVTEVSPDDYSVINQWSFERFVNTEEVEQ